MEKIAKLDGFTIQQTTDETIQIKEKDSAIENSIWEGTNSANEETTTAFGHNEIVEAIVAMEEIEIIPQVIKKPEIPEVTEENKKEDDDIKKPDTRGVNSGAIDAIKGLIDSAKKAEEEAKKQEELRKQQELSESAAGAIDTINSFIKNNPYLQLEEVREDNLDEFLDKYAEPVIMLLMNDGLTSRDKRIEDVKSIMNYIFKDAQYNDGIYTKDLIEDLDNALRAEKGKFIGFFSGDSTLKILDKLKDRKMYADGKDESANGKIDKNFKQGRVGDCWLLSSIYAIAQNPKGRQILEDSIDVLENGDVYVTLHGVDVTYKITYEELNGSEEYSRGDMDVRALELAVERYLEREKGDDIRGDIDDTAYEILLGKTDSNWWHGRRGEDFGNSIHFDTSFYDRVNDPNYICTASTNSKDCKMDAYSTDGELLPDYIVSNHAYSVVGADEDNVYLVNPWDTSKTIRISKQEFEKYFTSLGSIDMGD